MTFLQISLMTKLSSLYKLYIYVLIEALFVIFGVAGKAGWAAPRLKDAALSLDKLREGYVEVCPVLCLLMLDT